MKNVTQPSNKKVINIINMLDGRYCFRTIPQERRGVYFEFVCAKSNEEAIKRAKTVNPNFDYAVINHDFS